MIEIRSAARAAYSDVYTPDAVEALKVLAPLDADRHAVMASRIERRAGAGREPAAHRLP